MSDEPVISPFLTLDEAAVFLRLSRSALNNMRQRGNGPVYAKHGSRVVYLRSDLLAWSLASRRTMTAEKATPPDPSISPMIAEPTDTTGASTVPTEQMAQTGSAEPISDAQPVPREDGEQ